MALPSAAPDRQVKHRRSIDVQVYARPDGQWEVDARLSDTKARDWPLPSGLRPAGSPIHEMLLRLVVDTRFQILEAGAETLAMPYPGQCDQHGDAYSRLVGLNLLQGFRQAVKERLGGLQGCTHITELAQVLPTAVIQAFAGEVLDTQEAGSGGGLGAERPFQIDRCHALRSDGEVVRLHYPRWFQDRAAHSAARAPAPGAAADNAVLRPAPHGRSLPDPRVRS